MTYETIHDLACSYLPNLSLSAAPLPHCVFPDVLPPKSCVAHAFACFCLLAQMSPAQRGFPSLTTLPQATLPCHSSSRSLILLYFLHKVSLPMILLYISLFMTVCCLTLDLSLIMTGAAISPHYRDTGLDPCLACMFI